MNLSIQSQDLCGIIHHFARHNPAKALDTVLDWTRDRYDAAARQMDESQLDTHKALRLAAERLHMREGAEEVTLNRLVKRIADDQLLVAVPAVLGLAGPVVFAFGTSREAFQLTPEGDLVELPLKELSTRRAGVAVLDDHEVFVNRKTLDFEVTARRGAEVQTFRSPNNDRDSATFGLSVPGSSMKTGVCRKKITDATVSFGQARYAVVQSGDGFACSLGPAGSF